MSNLKNIPNNLNMVEANSIEAFDALRDHLMEICSFPEWLVLTAEQEEREDEIRTDLAHNACNLPENRMIINAFFVQNADGSWAPENILEISHALHVEGKDYHADNTWDDEQKMLLVRPVQNRKFGPVRAPKNTDDIASAMFAMQESPDAEEDFKAAMLASGMINDDDKIVKVFSTSKEECAERGDGVQCAVMTYLTGVNVITTMVKNNNLIVLSGIDCERVE